MVGWTSPAADPAAPSRAAPQGGASEWWPLPRSRYAGYQVPEMTGNTRVVSSRFVADAHRAGLGVQVWTVDTEPDARRLLEWGVDGLITDRPDLMLAVLGSMF